MSFSPFANLITRNVPQTLLIGACIATTGLSIIFLSRRKKQIVWVADAGTITHLFVYPIKSVAGLPMSRVKVTPSGFSYGIFPDR